MPDKDTTPVEYREISRFPGYRFGSDGTVWTSLKNGFRGIWQQRILKLDRGGYLTVNLIVAPQKWERPKVHQVILEAFKGPCPAGMQSRHLNGIRTDNRIENLAWGTYAENLTDRERHGNISRGEKHFRAKLTDQNVRSIRALSQEGKTRQEIARMLHVSWTTVDNALARRTWRHVI